MSFFRQPKPRRFHHEFIYYDERNERLKQLEKQARQEMGFEQINSINNFRVSFSTERIRRHRHQQGLSVTLRFALIILVILLALFFFI